MALNCYCIYGNKQNGKDTFANYLVEAVKGNLLTCGRVEVVRAAFADPVKEVAVHLLGMPRDVAWGSQEQRLSWRRIDRNARQWLQWIGTELGRQQIHQNLWVRRMADRVREGAHCDPPKLFVISDGRFKNELQDFQEYINPDVRLISIKIERPLFAADDDSHPSEAELRSIPRTDFCNMVINDGSLEDLRQVAEKILNKYGVESDVT